MTFLVFLLSGAAMFWLGRQWTRQDVDRWRSQCEMERQARAVFAERPDTDAVGREAHAFVKRRMMEFRDDAKSALADVARLEADLEDARFEIDRETVRCAVMHRRAQAAEGRAYRLRAWALQLRELTRAARDGERLSEIGQHALASMPYSPPTACSGPLRWCGCGDGYWPTRNDDDDCERCKELEDIYK